MVPVAVVFGVTSAVALLALAVGVWMGLELAACAVEVPEGDGGDGCYGRREER